ncbi:amidohydrolase [Streptomyces sp. NPDC001508]|uniref:amidohydrolase n=1 Tax=Streptomyces sp. NPDC001508 TaxID=3154656 RepID=UPI0033212469
MTHADLVFANGPVWTGDAARSWATAVAVRGGRITAVGHAEVRELIGPRTERIDLHGRLLVPGFQDAHVHPVFAGLTMLTCDLAPHDTAQEYAAAIAQYAAANPDKPWITGGGWSFPAFPGGLPTRQQLDTVVADRPAYLTVRDGHSAWANSRALEIAGITRDTPDPVGGRIERDADGNPTGVLHEQAMVLVGDLAPHPTEDELMRGLLAAQAHLHALGITAWQDAIVGAYGGWQDQLGTYLEAARTGVLTARVRGALWWDRERGLEQIDDLLARRAKGTVGRFTAGSVKIMQDGVPENFTAALSEPYLDGCGCATNNRGLSMVDPELLREAVVRLHTEDFQVHFHAIGDRAVTEVLDAVEAAHTASGRRDLRHHAAHLQVVHPRDLPRFRTLRVAANMQPLWAAHEQQMDEMCIPYLGERRAAWQYPFGALLREGAVLAAGSDWMVSSPDPMHGIHVAVNRTTPDADAATPVFLPHQRLDLGSALAAYTAGSAYVNHLDDTGSIVVGKLADLTVLDRNPFDGPARDIAHTRALLTYVEGERVHAAHDA